MPAYGWIGTVGGCCLALASFFMVIEPTGWNKDPREYDWDGCLAAIALAVGIVLLVVAGLVWLV